MGNEVINKPKLGFKSYEKFSWGCVEGRKFLRGALKLVDVRGELVVRGNFI
jgi:hypothetical protein